MSGLTRMQAKALDWIRSYIAEHGYPPAYADIAAGLGLKSKSGIHRLVHGLIERGAITSHARRGLWRTIALTPESGIALTLPQDLDRRVRALAQQAGVTPQAIITECVRDRLVTIGSHFASHETSGAGIAPARLAWLPID